MIYSIKSSMKYCVKSIGITLVVMLMNGFMIKAQDTIPIKLGDDIQEKLENVAENTESEEADYTDLLQGLLFYKEHPINLNRTNREELAQLQLLNDIQINNLLTHIEKTGNLITIYELQGIDGFDLQTIQKILPFVYVTDNFTSAHFNLKEMFRSGSHVLLFRYGQILEKQTGFTAIDSLSLYNSPNSRYIGSPQKLYARYRFTYGTNVSWGITGEKDQGELFLKDKQRFKYPWYEKSLNGNQGNGFDFYSAHFFLKNIRFIKSLAIGDYKASFGQGLTLWSGQSFGKSADIMSAKKSADGIRPFTSVDENRFMRGAATTIRFKAIELSGFISRKKVDANIILAIDTTGDGELAAMFSLQQTGYHTTPNEIADKHSISQTIYGSNVSYKGRRLDIGLTALNNFFDRTYKLDSSYYILASKQNINVGLDYNFIVRNFNFYGEEAMSQNGGKALLNGVLMSLDPRVSFTIVHRYYERNYQNLLSNAFAESTTIGVSNEKGTYIGMVAKPTNSTTLTTYYDHFEFPWLKYQVNAPSHGNDFVAQFNYTPSKKVDMYFKFRQKNKEKNTDKTDAIIDYIVPLMQTSYRFNIGYSILPSVKLKNRVELLEYKLDDNKTQKGYLVYQDFTFNKMGKPLSVTLRYAMFETDSYDSRIYAFENDVPGSYSIPAFYDRGSRFYIMLDYMVTHRIELWVRYSQTFYDNKNIISQGALTEIQGNTKSEIKAQVSFKF